MTKQRAQGIANRAGTVSSTSGAREPRKGLCRRVQRGAAALTIAIAMNEIIGVRRERVLELLQHSFELPVIHADRAEFDRLLEFPLVAVRSRARLLRHHSSATAGIRTARETVFHTAEFDARVICAGEERSKQRETHER